MKKILLTTATLAALSTSTFAAEVDQYYGRFDGTLSAFTRFKTSNKASPLINKSFSLQIKQKIGGGIDVGGGKYFTDIVRLEGILNFPFAPKMKGKKTLTCGATQATKNGALTNYGAETYALTVTHKPTINFAVLGRVAVDVLDFDFGKFFLNAGAGFAQVKDSVQITGTYTRAAAAATPAANGAPAAVASAADSKDISQSYKAKNKINPAWTVGFGFAFEIYENVHLDAAYSYRNYGKSRNLKGAPIAGNTNTLSAAKLASHNGSIGIRYDI